MPTRDERQDIEDQFSGTKTRDKPTTIGELWRNSRIGQAVNDVVSTTLGVLSDMPGEVFNTITGIVSDIEDDRKQFTTGRWVEEIQKKLRESGFEDQAQLLGDKLANNPEIAEEKLTLEDLRAMGIDMSEGRTEMVGEPERETGEPRFILGQNRTPEFEYDTLGETEEETDRTEKVNRDMFGLEELEARSIPGSGSDFEPLSKENADLSGPEDPEVAKVQGALEQLGFDIGEAGVDGYFGDDTEKAVLNFQQRFSEMTGETIPTNGRVDTSTIRALRRAIQEGIQF